MTVMKMVQCAGCELPILDRFIFSVLDRSWHDKCVQCADCKCNLADKCFSRDGKLFCRNDFFKRFGTKCAGCCQGILPTDLVRRARNKVFHIKCFTCLVCRKQLSTGEQLYVLEENRFVCVKDYNSGRHNAITSAPHTLGVPATQQQTQHHHHQALINDTTGSNGDSVTGGDEPDLDDSLQSPSDGLNGDHRGPEDLDSDGEETGSLLGLEPLNTMTALGHHHGHSMPPHHGHHHHLSAKSSPMSATSSMSDSGIGCSGASTGAPGGLSGPGSMMDPNSPSSHHMNGPGGMANGAANDENAPGTKRRGPRTTIKAKQLETLKAAFAATPKPTRHIREQLANETGLNMRVIQVWFQNRRSKERRMKQLNSLGARRHFFRNSRRAMRPLRPGMSPDGVSVLEDSPESMGGGGPPGSGASMPGGPPPSSGNFGYFSEASNPSDFQYGVPLPPGGYFDFYPPGQGPPMMGEGGMVPPYGGPGGHGPPPPPASVPNMHGDMHQPGILNLGADAPYMGADRGSVSPSSSLDGGLSMPSMTPDTFGRPNSASSGPPGASNGFQPMETSVW